MVDISNIYKYLRPTEVNLIVGSYKCLTVPLNMEHQYDRNKHGKEELTSLPRMKNVLLNRFLPTKCSTEFLNRLYKKEKEEEVKHLVADDFTRNICLTKVPFESYGGKHNELSELEISGVSEALFTDGGIETLKKTTQELEDAFKHTNEFQNLDSNTMASECEKSCALSSVGCLDAKGVIANQKIGAEHEDTRTKALNTGSQVLPVNRGGCKNFVTRVRDRVRYIV